jgi:hypothetical protein
VTASLPSSAQVERALAAAWFRWIATLPTDTGHALSDWAWNVASGVPTTPPDHELPPVGPIRFYHEQVQALSELLQRSRR